MNESSIIAIQARIGSKRFPQKVLQKVCGTTLIEHLVRNLLRTGLKIYILVPQMERSSFIFLEYLVTVLGVDCLISDVLTRYAYCARVTGAQNIIRVTGDNPVTSVKCLMECLNHHIKVQPDLTTMVDIPYGTGVEVLSKNTIFKADLFSKESHQREHVCSFIYENPDFFLINKLSPIRGYQSNIRVSIDTEEDLTLYKERLYTQRVDGKSKFLDLDKLIQDSR